MRVPHDCKDCTDVPVLFSLLVNTTVQHVMFIFGANSGLSHPRRTAMCCKLFDAQVVTYIGLCSRNME